jgi:predicted GNAT family acetyltransferase
VDITHTFTPPAARGRGLAARLAAAAFAWAAARGAAVRPSCSYISDTYAPAHAVGKGWRAAPGGLLVHHA